MITQLKTQFQTLLMAHTSQTIEQHLERVRHQPCSFEQFLSDVLAEEINHRKVKRIENRLRQAQIPLIKSIESFDFAFPKQIPKQLILSCLSGDYIQQKKNIIFLGAPGVGKTHIATALAHQACVNDFSCRFITAINLINELNASLCDNSFLKCLKRFTRYQLLVIDELGYLPVDKQGCDLFFQVISNRYEMGSVVITTNRPFREWGDIFNGDATLASAIIDRLIHHCEIIKIEGDSYRVNKK